MNHNRYDEPVESRRLAPAQPAVIWGALMIAALAGAGVTAWRGPGPEAAGERLVAASDDNALRQNVARLAAERDELRGRLASLERGVGELKLAARSAMAPETTGSIGRPQPASPEPRGGGFGLSLGPDASLEAVKRRWTALSARHPQLLAKLAPKAQRSSEGPGVYDLVAGPFANRGEADRTCAALAEQGLACNTTSYVGDPIGRP